VLSNIPGLIILVLSVNIIGRKKSLALYYTLSAIFLLFMLLPVPDIVLKVFVVCARVSVGNAYSSANLMTPELYPTVVRATGTGLMAGIARIAAATTPFISNAVFELSKGITFTTYGVVCAIGLVAVYFIPYDTKNKELRDTLSPRSQVDMSQ
jgi:putative MFS transporter